MPEAGFDGMIPLETNWTLIYSFNSFLYFALSVISLSVWIGTWLWPVRVIGICAHSLGAVAHFFAIVMTGVLRFNEEGKECARRDIEYD